MVVSSATYSTTAATGIVVVDDIDIKRDYLPATNRERPDDFDIDVFGRNLIEAAKKDESRDSGRRHEKYERCYKNFFNNKSISKSQKNIALQFKLKQ